MPRFFHQAVTLLATSHARLIPRSRTIKRTLVSNTQMNSISFIWSRKRPPWTVEIHPIWIDSPMSTIRLHVAFQLHVPWRPCSSPLLVFVPSTQYLPLFAIPTWIGDHNRWNAFNNWSIVAWHMNAKQIVSVYHCVVFIYAIGCSTITYIVLSTSCNFFSFQQQMEGL